MPTIHQLCKKKRERKRKINKTPALNGCPQKKGICLKYVWRSPRKPNSAKRDLAQVNIPSINKIVYAYIPGEEGEGYQLGRFATVLLRGCRVKDLPGIKYQLIRGKLDFIGVKNRKTSRSKYGVKKDLHKHRYKSL